MFSDTKIINFICDRRFGVGADGLMLLENDKTSDFKMVYYNSDGNESSMCGNGGRCLTKFAYDNGIQKSKYYFNAIDGPHESIMSDNGWIHLKMMDVNAIEKNIDGDVTFYVLNTGSPAY